jgi:hypothetical protein
MVAALRAVLYAIAAVACLLGLWGIAANLAVPLMPHYGQAKWDFYGPFADWDPRAAFGKEKGVVHPWWALSFHTPCPYLDSWLAGPVGYAFYALCLTWGLGTVIILRSPPRAAPGRAFWRVGLFGAWWLSALGGIVALVLFFVSITREAARAGLWP